MTPIDGAASRRLRTRPEAAQALVLVHAVEHADRRGLVLTREVRRQATAAARKAGEDDAWPARRAVALLAELGRTWTFLPRLLRWTRPGGGLLVPAAVVALVAGLFTNALGPERRIHVLALPLAGILTWNLAVLVFLAVRRWLPRGGSAWRESRPFFLDAVEAWARRQVARLPADVAGDDSERAAVARESLAVFVREWLPVISPLAAARVRRVLHVSALALVAGVVAGMYLRGVVFAYEATWESTFLSTETVERVAGLVLGPASAILGIEIPSMEPLRTSAGGASSRPGSGAGPWIHLWAFTAGLGVGLPRALLAAIESVRVARLGRRLAVTVPEVYLRRLLAAVSPEEPNVEVLPYSYRVSAAVSDALRVRLFDVFGARARIRIHSPLDYGSSFEPEGVPVRCRIALFNLAQTPEVEVHGAFLAGLRRGPGAAELLVALVDSSAYRDRLGEAKAAENRFEERRRAWDRALRDVGLEAVHLDLRRDDADTLVAALSAAGEDP